MADLNIGNNTPMSVSDMCGYKVLNMSMPLTDYINNGNTSDSYVPKQNESPVKPKKRFSLEKLLRTTAVAFGVVAGTYTLFKTGKNKNWLGKMRNFFTNLNIKDKTHNLFKKVKKFLKFKK